MNNIYQEFYNEVAKVMPKTLIAIDDGHIAQWVVAYIKGLVNMVDNINKNNTRSKIN